LPSCFVSVSTDAATGKTVGWVPVDNHAKEDKWHMEAFSDQLSPGTYELVGPKIQGNPEGYNVHTLVKHSEAEIYSDCPRTYVEIYEFLKQKNIEGIVFHHPDGRMAKIKKRDFGLKRI